VQDPPLADAAPPDPDSPRDPGPAPDNAPGADPATASRDPDRPLGTSWSQQLDPSRRDLNLTPERPPDVPSSRKTDPAGGDIRSTDASSANEPARSADANRTAEIDREAGTTRPMDATGAAGGPEAVASDPTAVGAPTSRSGTGAIGGGTAGRPAARWGEPGYRAPPDPNRPTRVAAAWIIGGIGAVVLALVAVGVLGVTLLAVGQRQDNSTGAVPGSVAPLPTEATPTTADPNAPPTTAPGTPPTSAGGSRFRNADYSIRVPDGYRDVTDSWRSEHPGDRNVVQVLAGAPGSPATTSSTIVIGQLPEGAAQGRSLNRLMADRLRTLRSEGARNSGQPRNTSIGPDPAVEADLTQRVAGELTHRTEVLAIHRGRVWEIAVTSPDGTQTLAAQAWLTVRNGWQWQ
jgi:hypothetical protein